MRTAQRCLVAWLAVLSLFLGVASALAQDRIDDLKAALRSSDFRVRTQAALALGASADQRAVDPLCSALSDENTTVRAASASAIGRLAMGGEKCLRDRLNAESNEAVVGVIQRALERVSGGGAGGSTVDANTRYYVAIGDVTNKTNRSNQSVNSEIRKRLIKVLGKQSGYAFAPSGETVEQAKGVKQRFPQLKTVLLWPKLEITYAGGSLGLRLELSLFSYPDRSFLGTMSRKLSMSGTSAGDTDSENELIEMAVDQLAPDLAGTVAKL